VFAPFLPTRALKSGPVLSFFLPDALHCSPSSQFAVRQRSSLHRGCPHYLPLSPPPFRPVRDAVFSLTFSPVRSDATGVFCFHAFCVPSLALDLFTPGHSRLGMRIDTCLSQSFNVYARRKIFLPFLLFNPKSQFKGPLWGR